MDKNRFDGLTRTLAQRENRRQALKTLFAGGLGTAAAVVAGGDAEAAKTDCCPATAPTLCNLTCTDTIYDETNCGGCGVTCAEGQRCYKGVCESESVVHCATVADCPGSNTECSTRTCKQGVCGVSYAANGKKTATQIAGDCQKNVCDGAGNVITIVDNTDKPAAQNECTIGICVDGVPHQNARPAGRKCATGTCDGAGNCSGGGCTSASTCPGTDTECAARTCTSGVCGMSFTPNGTVIATQTMGDCLSRVCDGAGNIVPIVDDNDVPPADECVTYSCSEGTLQSTPLTVGSPCSYGFCDGSGSCAECLYDTDCPLAGGECHSISCSGGTCTNSFAAYGTVLTTQIPGDCHVDVCDGSGGITSIVDDNDAGVPSSECVTAVCNAGVPSELPKTVGEPCSTGLCDGYGSCLGCVTPADCGGGVLFGATVTCTAGMCGYYCNDGYGDCNPGPDGCETHIASDPNNCGACGQACQAAHATSSCSGGVCTIASCDAGYLNCDGLYETGCEVNPSIDPFNCGSCGHVCSVVNGVPICANGACGLAFCNAGWANCSGIPVEGCNVNTDSDDDHCGMCGIQCLPGQSCMNGVCG